MRFEDVTAQAGIAFRHTIGDAALSSLVEAAFGLPLGKRYGTLSRGTRTKFALALALCHDAELVVLDEPTSGLDPVFRRELLDLLTKILRGGRASILFWTHITADLDRIADYVTLLQRGRVVFSSSKDEILDRWGLDRGGARSARRPSRGVLSRRPPIGTRVRSDHRRRDLGPSAVWTRSGRRAADAGRRRAPDDGGRRG